jgi:hypothetical protein
MSNAQPALPKPAPYEGWKTGHTLEDAAGNLGWALEHLENEAVANASPPVLAAAWCVLQAIEKLRAGEAFSLRKLPEFELEGALAHHIGKKIVG